MIIGSPAKVARELSPENIARLKMSVSHYVDKVPVYKNELKKIG